MSVRCGERFRRHLAWLLVLFLGLAGAGPASAQNVPDGFVVETLGFEPGGEAWHDFAILPDGRILLCGYQGTVQILVGEQVFTLGVVPDVVAGIEQGMLSIEVDPGFPSSPYIYVYFTAQSTADVRLVRFTMIGDLVDPQSATLSMVCLLYTSPSLRDDR